MSSSIGRSSLSLHHESESARPSCHLTEGIWRLIESERAFMNLNVEPLFPRHRKYNHSCLCVLQVYLVWDGRITLLSLNSQHVFWMLEFSTRVVRLLTLTAGLCECLHVADLNLNCTKSSFFSQSWHFLTSWGFCQESFWRWSVNWGNLTWRWVSQGAIAKTVSFNELAVKSLPVWCQGSVQNKHVWLGTKHIWFSVSFCALALRTSSCLSLYFTTEYPIIFWCCICGIVW